MSDISNNNSNTADNSLSVSNDNSNISELSTKNVSTQESNAVTNAQTTDSSSNTTNNVSQTNSVSTVKSSSNTNSVYEAIKNNATISSEGLITTYGNGENFTVTLTYLNGTPVVGQHISMNLTRLSTGANKVYWATTDVEGIARLQINLCPGNYSSTYSFYGLNGTSNIKVKAPINLTGTDFTTENGSGSLYTVTLTDLNGNALVNQIVNITLSKGALNKTYQAITDSNGIASMVINLASGIYNVTYSFESDVYGSAISSSIITVNAATIENNTTTNSSTNSSSLPTITIKAKPSVSHSGYSYKWYITTFVNYCPLCHHYNTLTINPKGVYESELTCSYCDADYDGVTGRDKSNNPRAYLTTVTAPVLA